jgi:hypothetical protein
MLSGSIEYVVAPIHMDEHWTCAVIDLHKKAAWYFDSAVSAWVIEYDPNVGSLPFATPANFFGACLFAVSQAHNSGPQEKDRDVLINLLLWVKDEAKDKLNQVGRLQSITHKKNIDCK